MRRLRFMILGAIVGMVVASFVVPPLLIWYNEPGAITPGRQTQMICNIPTLIHYTTQRLLLGQAIGAVLGALLFFVIAGFAGASEEPAPAA
jgi:hypothetical protein